MTALVAEGYWVFTTTMLGPVDIVAIRGDPPEVRLFDVKTMTKQQRDRRFVHRVRSKTQKILGVQLIYVDTESGEVVFGNHVDDNDEPDTD